MSYSPVEIRHVRFGRSLLGYRRVAVDRVLGEIADSYEAVWQERMDLTDRVARPRPRGLPPPRGRGAAAHDADDRRAGVAGRPRGREAPGGVDPRRGAPRGAHDHRRGTARARAAPRRRPARPNAARRGARRRRRRRRRHAGERGRRRSRRRRDPCLYLARDGRADDAPPDPGLARSQDDRARRPARETRGRFASPRRPRRGRANDALIGLLAERLRVAPCRADARRRPRRTGQGRRAARARRRGGRPAPRGHRRDGRRRAAPRPARGGAGARPGRDRQPPQRPSRLDGGRGAGVVARQPSRRDGLGDARPRDRLLARGERGARAGCDRRGARPHRRRHVRALRALRPARSRRSASRRCPTRRSASRTSAGTSGAERWTHESRPARERTDAFARDLGRRAVALRRAAAVDRPRGRRARRRRRRPAHEARRREPASSSTRP